MSNVPTVRVEEIDFKTIVKPKPVVPDKYIVLDNLLFEELLEIFSTREHGSSNVVMYRREDLRNPLGYFDITSSNLLKARRMNIGVNLVTGQEEINMIEAEKIIESIPAIIPSINNMSIERQLKNNVKEPLQCEKDISEDEEVPCGNFSDTEDDVLEFLTDYIETGIEDDLI